jgi:putative tricarboxylic transport membrane protein
MLPGFEAQAAVDSAKVTIPAGPGGGWDRTGRLTMRAMQNEKLVSAVQFKNVPGGGGTIGLTEFVRTAKGDDTALLFLGVIMMSSVITAKSPITIDMSTPLACLTREYVGVAVPADSPFKTLADMVTALKADPSSVTVGGSGIGSVEHLTLALMAQQNQIPLEKLNFITFSGMTLASGARPTTPTLFRAAATMPAKRSPTSSTSRAPNCSTSSSAKPSATSG